MWRQVLSILLASTSALFASTMSSRAEAGGKCADRELVDKLLADTLPLLRLPSGDTEQGGGCQYVAAQDFNGDGSQDYAVVLTETIPSRKYGDGSPVQSLYITILLSQPTPYAPYQALLLPGYKAAIGSYSLFAERREGQAELVVVMPGYSSTRLRWNGRGFRAEHQAD